MSEETAPHLARALQSGDRSALSRAITALESRRPDRAALGRAVLDVSMAAAGKAWRIGITGVPGVGKSCFIEAFGMFLIERGHKVAVLAVDPTSERTRGSILGDKTRMTRLAAADAAFVRPSPTSGSLGGVGRVTRESMLLCEAAGYDVILVETVGVGQSETIVARMVDSFLFLVLPGAGDDLQGIKKGIVELADVIAVTKADGASTLAAQQAARHYGNALSMLEPRSAGWRPPVATISALEGTGIAQLWDTLRSHRDMLHQTGSWTKNRRAQNRQWFEALLEDQLRTLLLEDPQIAAAVRQATDQVTAGLRAPGPAVAELVAGLRDRLGA